MLNVFVSFQVFCLLSKVVLHTTKKRWISLFHVRYSVQLANLFCVSWRNDQKAVLMSDNVFTGIIQTVKRVRWREILSIAIITIQGDYKWYEWLHKFIDKKITAIQKWNVCHCKEQLSVFNTLCKFKVCSICCPAHVKMIFDFVPNILQ
jgi:hypothetical protein